MKILAILAVLTISFPRIALSEIPDSTARMTDTLSVVNREVHKDALRRSIPYIPSAVFIGYGFMSLNNKVVQRIDHSVYNDMQEDHPGFSTHIDTYLQYAPSALVGVLNIAGIKGKNSSIDEAALFALSTGIVSISVTSFKRSTNKFRPNQTSYTSFPSGHTSTAFAAAEFLTQEYGDQSIWFGIAGYTAATATGILRVYNNAHWFSDIVAGAGFGILSMKATYFLYPCLKQMLSPGKSHFILMPSHQKGYSGITFQGSF